MPKIEPIPPIAGADALFSLLALIQNPTGVKARLDELVTLQAEINATVEVHGKAAAIPGLYESARQDRQAAHGVLADAKDEAKVIATEAVDRRDRAQADAMAARAEAQEARRDREALDAAWQARQTQREQEMARQEQIVAQAVEDAQATVQQAEEYKARWEEAVAKLQAAGVSVG